MEHKLKVSRKRTPEAPERSCQENNFLEIIDRGKIPEKRAFGDKLLKVLTNLQFAENEEESSWSKALGKHLLQETSSQTCRLEKIGR